MPDDEKVTVRVWFDGVVDVRVEAPADHEEVRTAAKNSLLRSTAQVVDVYNWQELEPGE